MYGLIVASGDQVVSVSVKVQRVYPRRLEGPKTEKAQLNLTFEHVCEQ